MYLQLAEKILVWFALKFLLCAAAIIDCFQFTNCFGMLLGAHSSRAHKCGPIVVVIAVELKSKVQKGFR